MSSIHILGINWSHDRSACLLRDGKILVAVAEERLDRDKHSIGYLTVGRKGPAPKALPMRAISYCLRAAGAELQDLDLVVVDQPVSTAGIEEEVFAQLPLLNREKIKSLPAPSHHLAHAYSAYFTSPFEESAVFVADVYGSQTAAGIEGESGYYARGRTIEPIFKSFQNYLPDSGHQYHSLLYMYRFITLVLGFTSPHGAWEPHWLPDEAGKTMGLAAYGRRRAGWGGFVKDTPLKIDTADFDEWILANGLGNRDASHYLIPKIRRPEEPLTDFHKDLARLAQDELEKGVLHYVRRLHQETGSKNLCLAGGAGLNVLCNKRILEETPFRKLYVQPAATDDGTAIGCALYGWQAILNRTERHALHSMNLGVRYAPEKAVRKYFLNAGPVERKTLLDETALEISRGKVVGWFQGGSEFGPRALGGRSILADPRRADIGRILNARVKRREAFRPYGPTVLAELADRYFKIAQPSPFMTLAATVRTERKNEIPGIVHADGTARVQTLLREENPLYYQLIEAFFALTGVPLVVNTSFNTAGQPIVETPEDALWCFLNTGMDVLVIEDFLLRKDQADAQRTSGILSALKAIRKDYYSEFAGSPQRRSGQA